MVFSSLQFILGFMPIFFGCYYLAANKYKNIIILVGSLVFYFVGTIYYPQHYILFVCCIILDFLLGVWMKEYPKYKKILLWLGIGMHLLNLFVFKYLGFVVEQVSDISLKMVLPIGISFYTFQGISYLVDIYRCDIEPEMDLLRYGVYIAMFEQLIAGPIVKYSQVKDQLIKRKFMVKEGIEIFVFGLGLKVLLANPLGKMWTQVCAIGFDSISTPLAWLAVFAFSFQIYLDFFGYSLMAIGLGKMLGFNLPQNFNHPYISVTMSEFWRRWHMTLGSWFKTYVYIPLGGNRFGVIKTMRNLLIVWLLTGIWHGAGYNFIIWGLTLFIILVIEKFWIGDFLNRHRMVGHLYMLVLIPLTWAIFAIDDLGKLQLLCMKLFPFFETGTQVIFANDYIKYWQMYYPFLLCGVMFSTVLPYQIIKKVCRNKWLKAFILVIIFSGCIYCMYKGLDDPFLYFRF